MNDPEGNDEDDKFEINRLDSFSPQLDKLNVPQEEMNDIMSRVNL